MRLPSNRRGFTLIELLVVLAIIATLAGVVAPALFGNVGRAKSTAAQAQLDIFSLALDTYRLDVGSYPSETDGLQALRTAPVDPRQRDRWRGPYLRQDIPLDPWGIAWVYRVPGSNAGRAFELFSLGRDGRIGGTEEDSDVTSWGGSVSQ